VVLNSTGPSLTGETSNSSLWVEYIIYDALPMVSIIYLFVLILNNQRRDLDKVVEHLVKILASNTRLYVAKYPTGLDNKVKDFETVLKY
jgi:hypothetical protein